MMVVGMVGMVGMVVMMVVVIEHDDDGGGVLVGEQPQDGDPLLGDGHTGDDGGNGGDGVGYHLPVATRQSSSSSLFSSPG